VGETAGLPVGSLAPGQPGQAVSAVTGRPPLQRPADDSAMPGQPGERHAILNVRAQDLPAGHRLVSLLLGQIGQVPRVGAGHLSSVTPWPSLMPRYRRIRHLSKLLNTFFRQSPPGGNQDRGASGPVSDSCFRVSR
jgi:hypothetical protein